MRRILSLEVKATLLGLAVVAGAGCGAKSSGSTDAGPGSAPMDAGPADAGPVDAGPVDAGEPDAGPVDAGPVDAGPTLCAATTPPCQDQQVSQLNLFDTVNAGAVTEEGAAPTFTTYIDATAGGLTPNTSYVYAKFTDQGLSKVSISDEDAFTSTDWDIAFRRFVIRLNSGVSGPSCVEGARTATGTTFDGLTAVPANIPWRTEAYFSADTCDYVPDTSGIGSPATVLSSFWSYSQCVQMTHNVFVVHTREGRYVKLEVLDYYTPSAQMTCDSTGTVPQPSGSGSVRVKWAFIDGP